MDIIVQTVVQYVAEILGLLIVTAIGVLGAALLKKINQNSKLSNIAKATAQVVAATQETVRRLQQTLVDSWKENAVDGKLTAEQVVELKQKTIEITLEQLGQPILDLLAAAKIDVEAMITNAAESYINQMKEISWQV